MTTTNITYPFSEVFIVSPTDDLNKIDIYTIPDYEQYNKGYTFDEARNICQSYGAAFPDINRADISGADLATPERIYRAFELGANWCINGWGLDGKVYVLSNGAALCGQATAGVSSTGTPYTDNKGVQRAFPICYAPKPPNPSPAVQPFNKNQYNMILQSMLTSIMNGVYTDKSIIDIFPKTFTADQAYYALDQPLIYDSTVVDTDSNKKWVPYTNQTIQYNSSLKQYEKLIGGGTQATIGNGMTTTTPSRETLKYNAKAARSYLMYKFNTVNNDIIRKIDTTYANNAIDANWDTTAHATNTSCGLLNTVATEYSTKLSSLKAQFVDISESVISLIWAKAENTNIQATIYDVCSGTTPATSPACAKLATLDFDLFYTDQRYNTLADLETLNYNRYLREQELCTSIQNLKIVNDLLRCPSLMQITDCAGLSVDPTTRKIQQYDSTDPLYTPNTQYINFDTNNVEVLKTALMDISPLFQRSAYKDILTGVLSNLSFILRTPSLTDFSDSDMKFKNIGRAINDIKTILNVTS
jgi:hypothetical protein